MWMPLIIQGERDEKERTVHLGANTINPLMGGQGL